MQMETVNHRRAIASIHRLPPEVLCIVFTDLKNYTFDSDPFSDRSSSWDWVAVSHVCRFWRSTALSAPFLWSDLLNFKEPQKTRAFLERSGTADLTLTSKVGYRDDTFESLRLALENLYRIRSIKLITWQADTFEIVRDLFNRPAPRLQNLTLISKSSHMSHLSYFPESITSSQDLQMTLIQVQLPTAKLVGACFSRIKLQFVQDLSLPSFLSVLETSHGLKELCLHDVSWEIDSLTSELEEDRIVFLQNLAVLELQADDTFIPSCRELVKHIRIPCMTRWHLSCKNRRRSPLLNTNLYLDLVMASSECRCEKLQVTITVTSFLVVSHNTITGLDSSSDNPDTPSTELNLEWKGARLPARLFTHLELLIRSCHWGQTEFVHMELESVEWQVAEEHWVALLLALSSIKRLQIHLVDDHFRGYMNSNLANFVKVLTHTCDATIPEGSIICPKLECLSLHSYNTRPAFFDLFKRGLHVRKALGCGIKIIFIYSAHKKQLDEDDFFGLVQQLIWNDESLITFDPDEEIDIEVEKPRIADIINEDFDTCSLPS